jgi:hypothetical protein
MNTDGQSILVSSYNWDKEEGASANFSIKQESQQENPDLSLYIDLN